MNAAAANLLVRFCCCLPGAALPLSSMLRLLMLPIFMPAALYPLITSTSLHWMPQSQ